MKSPKERNKVYIAALQMNDQRERDGVNRHRGIGFCENAAEIVFKDFSKHTWITRAKFPEYFLFEPNIHGPYWFGDPDDIFASASDGNHLRQLALMFCIEMTK